MKIRVPVMIQDQMASAGEDLTEEVTLEDKFFLDGPVSERVAVLDFDPDGQLVKTRARFKPPTGQKPGFYAGADGGKIHSDAFIQVNAFATVQRVIALFEEADALGRRLSWGFDASQLLVVPRAGKRKNAYYERESHSLQFFYFPSARKAFKGRMVYTCLSHDIIAHETGHAVLDGIAPDLYHAISPQSLALHEAVADLTALIMAFRSRKLRGSVLGQTGGSIASSTAFSSIAEEFGALRQATGQLRPLRSLNNERRLPPSGGVRTAPHDLSEVLTGALYKVLIRMHDGLCKRYAAEREDGDEKAASGKALFVAGEHFKRMVLRALDYLPPGEISFADYGRAIIAADRASHPDWGRERRWLAKEFVERRIVGSEAELFTDLDPEQAELWNAALADVDLGILVASDWAAYEFANRYRDQLGCPAGVPLRVRPRLDVTKEYRAAGGGTRNVRECIFKVSWDAEEENPAGRGLPARRQITVGTMLAIDWRERTVRALLTSDSSTHQRDDRDAMLARLHDEGRLRVGRHSRDSDGMPLRSVAVAETSGDLLRIRKSARMLHVEGAKRGDTAANPFGDFGAWGAQTESPTPPPGVDASAFYNLIELRSQSTE